MKSNNALVGMSLLFLALATIVSTVVWNDISGAVKIGMYALGFNTGIAAGILLGRRKKIS